MERGKNYCNVGGAPCNRTTPMSCGGCITAIAACTDSLRRTAGDSRWKNLTPVSTSTSETLILYDPNGERIASATVQAGNLITTNYRTKTGS